MKVAVELFATLAAYLPPGSSADRIDLDVSEHTTVADVMRALEIPADLDCLKVVNGRDVDPGHQLSEGDVLTMFPPLAGGSGARRLR